MDIAELGLSVDTSQLEKGEASLDTFSATGKQAQASVTSLEDSIRALTSQIEKNATTVTRARATSVRNTQQKTQERIAVSATTKALIEEAKAATATAQTTDELARAANTARAANNALEAELGQLTAAQRRASDGLQLSADVKARATQATKLYTETVREQGKVQRRTAFRTQQLIFQLNDIGVSLASGQKPALVAIQQGSQLSQVYGGHGGVAQAFQDTARLAKGVVSPILNIIKSINPMILAATAATAVLGGLFFLMREAPEDILPLEDAIDDLGSSLEALTSINKDLQQPQQELLEQYGGTEAAIRSMLVATKELREEQAKQALQAAATSLANEDAVKEIAGLLETLQTGGSGRFSRTTALVQLNNDIGVSKEAAQGLLDGIEAIRNANSFEEVAQQAASLRSIVTELPDDIRGGVLDAILEIENQSRKSFGSSSTAAKAFGDAISDIKKITEEANSARITAGNDEIANIRRRTAASLQSIDELARAAADANGATDLTIINEAAAARIAVERQANQEISDLRRKEGEAREKEQARSLDREFQARERAFTSLSKITERADLAQLQAEGDKIALIQRRLQIELDGIQALSDQATSNGADQAETVMRVALARAAAEKQADAQIAAERAAIRDRELKDQQVRDREVIRARTEAEREARAQLQGERIERDQAFDDSRLGLNDDNDPLGVGRDLIDNEQDTQDELDIAQERFNRLFELNAGDKERQLELESEFEARRQAIILEGIRRANGIRTEGQQAALSELSGAFGQLQSVSEEAFGKQNALSRASIVAQQAFAIQSAILSINTGLAEASSLPFPLNIAEFARVAAQGISIISSIRSIRSAVSGGGSSSASSSAPTTSTSSSSSSASSTATQSVQQSGRISATPSAGLNASVNGASSASMPITVIDNVGIGVTVNRPSNGEIALMIDERVEASQVQGAQQVPSIVAGQLRSTNSPISTAIRQTTSAQATRP